MAASREKFAFSTNRASAAWHVQHGEAWELQRTKSLPPRSLSCTDQVPVRHPPDHGPSGPTRRKEGSGPLLLDVTNANRSNPLQVFLPPAPSVFLR